jgi:MOSC domain-containing protein YiiM
MSNAAEIQTLFGKKQLSLSQFNENTLVKGVRVHTVLF